MSLDVINIIQVYKIDSTNALILCYGSNSWKARHPYFLERFGEEGHAKSTVLELPHFPFHSLTRSMPRELIMKARETDPFEDYLHDNDVVDKE